MNYFRCKLCNALNPDDSEFCCLDHQTCYRACRDEFHTWLQRDLYFSPYEDWEYSFLPLDKGGIDPKEG